jgi:hypothetical protein
LAFDLCGASKLTPQKSNTKAGQSFIVSSGPKIEPKSQKHLFQQYRLTNPAS